MVTLYILAGLRREEALWLTHDDVDLDHRCILVRAKTINGQSWGPKTGKNRRVPISEALLAYLRDYHPDRTAPWFFPSPKGGWWDGDNFAADLRGINRRRGLDWCCRDYRHTFGSHLAQRGVSLYKISELMGNSPEICRRHYAVLSPETLVEAVEFHRPSSIDADREPAAGPEHDSMNTSARRSGLRGIGGG